ncbi:MAG: 3'(2'),5'-bisphosphate nucleotidase CysQ family protein [Beijerinckiaceae bacterium]
MTAHFSAAAIAGGRALLASPRTLLETKQDGSPVTPADMASDRAIRGVLASLLPDIPVVSEEMTAEEVLSTSRQAFILVDPLDGTKEFLASRDDFAICIALVESGRPRAGVILAPALRKLWIANAEASEVDLDSQLEPKPETRKILRLEDHSSDPETIIMSRSHADQRSIALHNHFPAARQISMGAALKFAALATGEACLYPRGAGSMEWDTAAGEALLLAAGGAMLAEDGQPMIYGKNKLNYRNRPFIAGRSKRLVQSAMLQWAAC